MYSANTGKAYVGYRPSKKSIRRMIETINPLTAHSVTWQGIEEVVSKFNRALRGWACPRAECGRSAVRFDERDVETELRRGY
jgi:hypothetical protein